MPKEAITEEIKEASKELGMPAMGRRWIKALQKWVKAGRPVRSQEEIARLHAICVRCKFYKADRCLLCGCAVSKQPVKAFGLIKTSSAMFNKLKMATEKCPKNKWRKQQCERCAYHGSDSPAT